MVDFEGTPMVGTLITHLLAVVLTTTLSLTSTQSLSEFTVSALTPLSDHSKITLYLNRAMLNHEASKSKELNNH